MSAPLQLADVATRDDLRIFLQRLQRAGEPEVRVVTRGRALALYGCTQAPRGILDPQPTVLVMRAFALERAPETAVDMTVLGRALLDRIARLGLLGRALELPDVPAFAAWAGVLPPTAGWQPRGTLDTASLVAVAADGIERVSQALPEQPGDAVVQRVRGEVWGVEIADGLPAAVAFAAETMGFLGSRRATAGASNTGATEPLTGDGQVPAEVATVFESRSWTRVSTARGHVLVRGFSG